MIDLPNSETFAAALAEPRVFAAMAVAALAGLVRGFSGFGGAMIYMPLIAAIYDPRIAAVTILVVDFVSATPFAIPEVRRCTWREVGPLSIALAAGLPRSWPVASSNCGLPANAGAYSMNATVVPPAGLGYLTMWPTGQAQPLVSTLNAAEDPIVANALIVSVGTAGAISSFASSATHLVLDVNGYFAP